MGLVKREFPREALILAGLQVWMHRSEGGFASFGLEEFAQLLAQRKSCAVEPALDGGNGQVEGGGDVLVGEAVDVLEEEDRSIVVGKLGDGLLDGGAQLGGHRLLVGPLRPVARRI